MNNSKKIKVIPGKGKNLKISNVKDHLTIEKHKQSINKNNIVIPTEKK